MTRPTLYTDDQVAQFLGIKPRTVRNLRLTGALGYTRIGRVARVTEDQLNEYLERQKVNPCPTASRSAATGSASDPTPPSGAVHGSTLEAVKPGARVSVLRLTPPPKNFSPPGL